MAREELKSMGPMSKAEWILALDFILLFIPLDVGDLVFHIPATISAFIGLVILLLTNIMSWKKYRGRNHRMGYDVLVCGIGDDGKCT